MNKAYLMVPGPTAVPERVLQATHRPLVNHRGALYEEMFSRITAGLKTIFRTRQDVLVFPAAGTGMLEAAVVNTLSPGDKVLAVSIGVFGDRFAEIAARFGADVEVMAFPWGRAAEPERVAERVAADKDHRIKAILVTHNETSTGVVNDLAALAKARGDHPALLIVDAVSSLGAADLATDDWRLDVVVTGSQKALMTPPGLGFMAMSERAWTANAQSTMPKFYWDAQAAKKAAAKGQNPYTPAVSLLFGLEEALKMLAEEGLDNSIIRHKRLAEALRAGFKALGLKLLAEDAAASPGVTAVFPPDGVEAKKIQKVMRERFGITLAGGQKQLENKIFRVGHLGYVVETDILVTLAALEITLSLLGANVELGSAVKAAGQVIAEG